MTATGHPGELSGETVLRPSKYFHPSELACHDGTPYPAEWGDRWQELATLLDRIREAWGRPLRVVSGYRSPAWNDRVGGAGASQHMAGRACDIAPVSSNLADDVSRLHVLIVRIHGGHSLPQLGGLGFYAGRWCHVDTARAADGHLRRWTGTAVGDELTA